MPQQPTQTPIDVKGILDPLQVDTSVKADVWDAYHNAKTPQDFQASFDKLNIPQEAKAALWDAKFSNLEKSSTGIVMPKGTMETPGEFKSALSRLTAPYDPGAQEFADKHPVLGGPVRFLSAAGGALLSVPGQLYHAAADPLTPEEEKDFQGHTRIPGELTLERLTGARQIVESGKAYSDSKTRPTLKQAASIAPEALGTGVGTVSGAELTNKAIGKVVGTPAEAKARLQPFLRKTLGIEQAVEGEATKAAEGHAKDLATNKAKRGEVMKDNLETQRAARTNIDREKLATEEKNKQIESSNKAAQDEVTKRHELTRSVDEQSVSTKKAVESVERAVYEEANKKFDAVREKIPADAAVPADALVGVVKNAETETLQNIPENIKEFRSILRSEVDETIQRTAERHGFENVGPEPMTWQKLQSLKSRLDARLRSRSPMNGDLKRALFQTRDAVVDEMGKLADSHGAKGEWQSARDFWRQYKEDFTEATGPSGSGSPVAQSLNAVDPAKIRQPFLGSADSTLGNRGAGILRKYGAFGGNEAAASVEKLVETNKSMLELPKKAKVAPSTPQKEVHQLPENKALPARPVAPTVDAKAVALRQILSKSKNIGSFNARDVGIIASSVVAEPIIKALAGKAVQGATSLLPTAAVTYEGGKFAASRILRNPKVAEWLSRTPPEEASALRAVLDSMPGGDKVKVINMLTEEAKAAAKGGKLTQLSAAAKQILGDKNVAAVTALGAQMTPGDARERMRSLAPNQP